MENPRYLEFALFITSIVIVSSVASSIFQQKEPSPTKIIAADILVYGGSLGGVSAAITAAENGIDTILVLDTSSIGGQAVESGNSAFDDTQSTWENYGIYADIKQYLKIKYPATGTGSYGLGEAAVGEVASLPRDIEEYFLARMKGNVNLRILRDYQLSGVMRDRNKFVGAKFTNNNDHTEELLIRFLYLIDGTQAGKLFDKAKIPYSLGFDSAEETKETSALPRQVRDFLVYGYEKGKKVSAAFGNRVQSLATPFALVDKGYPGDFYPVSDAGSDCWGEVPGVQNFIKGSRVLESKGSGCSLTVNIVPDFDDTYDVYHINHGRSLLEIDVASPAFGVSMNFKKNMNASQQFYKIGTFYIAREQPLSLTVHASSAQYQVEGVILVRRNLHQTPIIIREPSTATLSLNREGLSPTNAGIFIVTKRDDERERLAFLVDDTEVVAQKIGTRTYMASAINIGLHPHIDLGEVFLLGVSNIQVVPSDPTVPFSQMLLSESGADINLELVKNNSHFSQAKVVKEQSFQVDSDGEYIFSIDWFKSKWALFELYDVDNQNNLIFFPFKVQNYSRGQDNPFFSTYLKKGVNYRVRMGLSMDIVWTPFTLSISQLDLQPLYRGTQFPPEISGGQCLSGMYDIWIKGAQNASAVVESPLQKNQVKVSSVDTYNYGGKFFLHSQYDLRSNDQAQELIAIPNFSTDVFVIHATQKSFSGSLLKISQLPAGYYQMVAVDKDANGIESVGIISADGHVEDIPLRKVAGTFVSQSHFLHTGAPAWFTLKSTEGSTTDVDIYFFEDVPNYEESSLFLSQYPLFRDKTEEISPREAISQFSFRNIVSAKNLFNLNISDILLSDISRDTQGVTLMIDPSNDYAPVLASDFESANVAEKSRDLSYAYYYWLKYDAKAKKEYLGCSPNISFTCDPRRIQIVVGIFSDKRSPFPPKPYFREGRRLKAVQMVSENDLSFHYHDCVQEECSDVLCVSFLQGGKSCLLKEQKPILFSDAIAASYYQIDIHSFFTRKELFIDLPNFLSVMKEINLLTSQQTLFNRYQRAMPAEVRLGSLLSASGTNILPASMNIGVTQIANGAYRTHTNELAIGQSVGYLSAYCIKKNKAPLDVYRDPKLMKEFQHFLVEKGANLYPIYDMNEDSLLRKAVQHLIVDGMLSKQIQVIPSNWWAKYTIQSLEPASQDDDQIALQIFGKNMSITDLTMKDLILAFGRLDQTTTAQELLSAGKSFQLLSRDADQSILNYKISRAALYKAYYLRRGQQAYVSEYLIR